MRVSDAASGKLITMRHEEKFICSDRQMQLLDFRLRSILQHDHHQTGDDYQIRSLYLDTFDDRLYRESLAGVKRRHKYRIRFYDMKDDFFRLERKDTVDRLKQKVSSPFTKNEVGRLLAGKGFINPDDLNVRDVDAKLSESARLLNREVYALQQTEGLHPVAIVEYRRSAFVYPIGNVRITLDKDIGCTYRVGDFLDPHALLIPVMPYGRHVLEVKYDGILPGFISEILNVESMEQISFSKYAYARNVIENNGRKEEGYEC